MAHSEHARRQLERDRADLKRQLDAFESGQQNIDRSAPNRPATEARMAELRRKIADLDKLLSESDA